MHLAVLALLLAGFAGPAAAQEPADRVAALKASLAAGLAGQKKYEWVETTALSLKGEEKSRKQNRCYYGADGALQKVPIEDPAAEAAKSKRGVRGKVVENKKDEIAATMKAAVALVKQYIPPDPARIQAAKAAGKLSVTPPDAAGRLQVKIADYLKPGDSMVIDMDGAKNTVLGVGVSTYLEAAKDAVTMKAKLGTLEDGTIYPATIDLNVASANVAVAIQNTGYKKTGS
jgi:hypothetical protein